jgi:hypothetical protein
MGFPDGKGFQLKGPGPRHYAHSLYYLRDSIGFQMFRSLGRWSPRTQFCVLFVKFRATDGLQDQYQGVYLFEVIYNDNNNRLAETG